MHLGEGWGDSLEVMIFGSVVSGSWCRCGCGCVYGITPFMHGGCVCGVTPYGVLPERDQADKARLVQGELSGKRVAAYGSGERDVYG